MTGVRCSSATVSIALFSLAVSAAAREAPTAASRPFRKYCCCSLSRLRSASFSRSSASRSASCCSSRRVSSSRRSSSRRVSSLRRRVSSSRRSSSRRVSSLRRSLLSSMRAWITVRLRSPIRPVVSACRLSFLVASAWRALARLVPWSYTASRRASVFSARFRSELTPPVSCCTAFLSCGADDTRSCQRMTRAHHTGALRGCGLSRRCGARTEPLERGLRLVGDRTGEAKQDVGLAVICHERGWKVEKVGGS